jgi:hypothetical protein
VRASRDSSSSHTITARKEDRASGFDKLPAPPPARFVLLLEHLRGWSPHSVWASGVAAVDSVVAAVTVTPPPAPDGGAEQGSGQVDGSPGRAASASSASAFSQVAPQPPPPQHPQVVHLRLPVAPRRVVVAAATIAE